MKGLLGILRIHNIHVHEEWLFTMHLASLSRNHNTSINVNTQSDLRKLHVKQQKD